MATTTATIATDNAVNDPSDSGLTSFLNDNDIDYSASSYHSELAKLKYLAGKIKFKNKGIQAGKELFLFTPSSCQDIPEEVMMKGLITSTPYRGTHGYKIT